MAHHPLAVGRAFVYVAELLLDQRVDAVAVAVMPVILRQVLAAHELRFMSTTLIALVRDAIVRRKDGQHWRRREARRRESAVRTRDLGLPFAHAAPFPERSAGSASIVVEGHLVFPLSSSRAALNAAGWVRQA